MINKTTLINIKGGKGPRRELRERYGANKKLEKALDLLGQAQNRIRELLNGVEIELPNTIHEADMYDVFVSEVRVIDQKESRVQVSFRIRFRLVDNRIVRCLEGNRKSFEGATKDTYPQAAPNVGR